MAFLQSKIFSGIGIRSKGQAFQCHDIGSPVPFLVFSVDVANREVSINGSLKTTNFSLGVSAPVSPVDTTLYLFKSDASIVPHLLLEQSGVGDAALRFFITGGQSYTMGVDNSQVGDPFKISFGAVLGTSDMLFMDNTDSNIGIGLAALGSITPTVGINNIAIGAGAGSGITVGDNNILIGNNAGSSLTNANDNIYIGNIGLSFDDGVIRIGNITDHNDGVFFPPESSIHHSGGRYYLEEFFKRLPKLNASIGLDANLDFELQGGLNASDDDITYSLEIGGIKLQTDALVNSGVIIAPHLNVNQSAWNSIKWGTENKTEWECAIRTGSDISNIIIWAGLKLTNSSGFTDNDAVFFTYTTVLSGEILSVESIGGSNISDTTGVIVASNTTYRLRICIQSNRRARMYINDVHVYQTAALTDDIDFKPYIGIENLDTLAKDMTVSYQKISRLLFE